MLSWYLGVPGYSVFSNLYLSAGGFTFVEPESGVKYKKLPGTRQILSGPKQKNGHYPAADEERWRIIGNEQASGELGSRALHLKGVTVRIDLFNYSGDFYRSES